MSFIFEEIFVLERLFVKLIMESWRQILRLCPVGLAAHAEKSFLDVECFILLVFCYIKYQPKLLISTLIWTTHEIFGLLSLERNLGVLHFFV